MISNDKIAALYRASKRLALLTSDGHTDPIGTALYCERRNAGILANVKIMQKTDYAPYHSPEATALMSRLRERMEAEFQIEAKAERDERLRAILAEIEALRGDICNAAAAAQIEAGQIAREIREMLEK